MITIEQLERELAEPHEDFTLTVEGVAALVVMETVRIDAGLGNEETLQDLEELLESLGGDPSAPQSD